MKALTDRQREVLDFIAKFSDDNAYPPTVREIGEHFCISLRAVQDHIAALQKKGYISLCQKRSRSIRVLKDERSKSPQVYCVEVPVMESVCAGKFSIEDASGSLWLSQPLVEPGKEYFAMRVHGDCMSGAGIRDGDLAVMEVTDTADDGQIVVAAVDNDVMLKRFCREASRVCLQPENSEFQPIYCQEVRVLGTLRNIIRTF